MRNRFQKQRKIDNKIRIFLPVMICGIMVAVLWNSSSQIFRETKKRQEESLKEAVIKGAVQCYSVEGRYPESLSYVTEKIRQWDEKDSIEIGSFHGRTALIHTEKINGKKYNTYLYQEKGALRELMVREGLDTTTMQGEKIVAAKDFSVIETKQLYHIKIQGSDGKIYQNCVYRHSRN